MLAILCRDGFGGFGGMTAAEYNRTADRDVLESYFAPRDDDHKLIPLAERLSEIGIGVKNPWKLFKTPEELGIPAAAYAVMGTDGRPPPTTYLLLFWTVWANRGFSPEQILQRWIHKIGTGTSLPDASAPSGRTP